MLILGFGIGVVDVGARIEKLDGRNHGELIGIIFGFDAAEDLHVTLELNEHVILKLSYYLTMFESLLVVLHLLDKHLLASSESLNLIFHLNILFLHYLIFFGFFPG